jgi:hypothetical protein
MLKRVHWIDNSVLNVRLRDNLFTLAQMRSNHLLEFFDASSSGEWETVDLSAIPVLFTIYVAENRLRPLLSERLPSSKVKPNDRPVERRMLSFVVKAGNVYSTDLVELTNDFSSVGAKVLKADLSPTTDLEVIHRCELTGMVGDPEKLRARLIRYFDAGVNWDESKSLLYPGIATPAPRPARDA